MQMTLDMHGLDLSRDPDPAYENLSVDSVSLLSRFFSLSSSSRPRTLTSPHGAEFVRIRMTLDTRARTRQGIGVASKAPPPMNDVLDAAVRYLSPDGPPSPPVDPKPSNSITRSQARRQGTRAVCTSPLPVRQPDLASPGGAVLSDPKPAARAA